MDQFADRIEIDGAPIEDVDIIGVQRWLQRGPFQLITNTMTWEGIKSAAKANAFHPVRDYLVSLTWDGVPRLDGWLVHYLGAVIKRSVPGHDIYVSQVGAKWMISAVARIMVPGAQVDSMIILEGIQGLGKSQALRTLASDAWFSDALPHDLKHKDSSEHLVGAWIIELSELGQMNKAEVEIIKGFLSRQVDRYRPSYGRVTVERPRQCLFAGTTNKGDYLRDESGNRRFWPILVLLINLAALKADRDMLWAEAKHRFDNGEAWYLDDDVVAAVALGEQDDRYAEDPWAEAVIKWRDGNSSVQPSASQVLIEAIGLDKGRLGTTEYRRVTAVMSRAGYVKVGKSNGIQKWALREGWDEDEWK